MWWDALKPDSPSVEASRQEAPAAQEMGGKRRLDHGEGWESRKVVGHITDITAMVCQCRE